jgi:6-phosphofructokinase 1
VNTKTRRIAFNVGGGFTPGLNALIIGAGRAADKWGWDLVGIRDGFAGLLFPERYPDGGLVSLDPQLLENLDPADSSVLGQAAKVDPFHVRMVNKDNMVEEVDFSDEILERFKAEGIDALISVVSGRGLSIMYKLQRKGLNTICIPRSIENDIATTTVSFGFNSALSFTIEMLDRARQAAYSARRIGVVEVQGEQAGWMALQAGIAVGADAVLIPEIPPDLSYVATHLKDKLTAGRSWGLVVVAEGVEIPAEPQTQAKKPDRGSLKDSLSPLATGEASEYVIQRSGQAAETVATKLQLQLAEEIYPLVLGEWVKGGKHTAVDRQLGICYGVGAVRALKEGKYGTLVAFNPPELEFIPLAEAINKFRTVPLDGGFIQIAHSLGICMGREL